MLKLRALAGSGVGSTGVQSDAAHAGFSAQRNIHLAACKHNNYPKVIRLRTQHA